MQIPVLVEPIANNGYRATARQPFEITVEGKSRDEVIRKVEQQIQEKLKAPGTEVVSVELPVSNPWLRIAGTLDPNDPVVQEWHEIMAENRRKADEDPDYP